MNDDDDSDDWHAKRAHRVDKDEESSAENFNPCPLLRSSKSFKKKPNDDNSRPLADCIAWALAHCTQHGHVMPMLVFVQLALDDGGRSRGQNQTPKIRREYLAYRIDSFFLDFCRGRNDSTRHLDEVIVGGAPCKAFCDFEFELTDEWAQKRKFATLAALLQHCGVATVDEMRLALETSAQRLIDTIVAHHAPTAEVRPFITISHKPSKWSMHVVFVNSLWAHAGHVGALIKRLVRESDDPLLPLYVDTQVYGKNRCMRMYRSSKPAEPQRSLLRIGETAAARVDEQTVLDSLITVFRTGDNKLVTSTYLASHGDRPMVEVLAELGLPMAMTDHEWTETTGGASSARQSTTRSAATTTIDESIAAAIRFSFPLFTPYRFSENVADGTIKVDIRERHCAIAGRPHDTQGIYIVVDLIAREWRHGCYSDNCKHQRWQWWSLPPSMSTACDEYRRTWPMAECFPSLKVPSD